MALTVEEVEAILRLKDQMSPGLKTAQGNMEKFAGGMKMAGVALSAAVTLPLVGIGTAAVSMGMDAVESENLFEVSFGGMAESARKWSEGLSASLGLNQFELRKTAGTLYTMFDSMGLGEQGAYDMATSLTELSGDLASFFNLKPEEAFDKLKSGIIGQTEPLRSLGILVDENATKMAAYKHGIAEQGAELTQQQKVLARYQAILDQTGKAQGDLARTIDSPTNQLRVMKSQIQEAATELGMSLMPVVTEVIGGIKTLVPYLQDAVHWFSSLSPAAQTTGLAIAGVAAAAGPVLIAVGAAMPAITAITGVFAAGSTGAAAFAAALTVLTGPVGWIIAAGAGILTVTGTWGDFFDVVKDGASIAWNLLKILGNIIKVVISYSVDIVKTISDWTGLTDVLKNAANAIALLGHGFKVGLDYAAGATTKLSGSLDDLTSLLPPEPFKKLIGEGLGPLQISIKDTGTEVKQLTQKQIDAKKAQEDYHKEIRKMVDQMTGKAAAAEMKKYEDAVKLAGGTQALTKVETEKLQKALVDLRAQGAIPARDDMQKLWREYITTNFNTMVLGTSTKDLTKVTQDLGVAFDLILPKAEASRQAFDKMVHGDSDIGKIIGDWVPVIKDLPAPPPDPWNAFGGRVKGVVGDITGTFSDNLVAMLMGQEGFRDAMSAIWGEIQNVIKSVLSDTLQYFLNKWLHSMIDGIFQADLGGKIGKNLSDGIGGGLKSAQGSLSSFLGGISAELGSTFAIFDALLPGKGLAGIFDPVHISPVSEAEARAAAENYLGPNYEDYFGPGFDWSQVFPGDIPGLATGGMVKSSGLAMIHKGETVVPATATPLGGNDALLMEMKSLRRELVSTVPTLAAIAARDAVLLRR